MYYEWMDGHAHSASGEKGYCNKWELLCRMERSEYAKWGEGQAINRIQKGGLGGV
jgi:hypothetical protein